MTTSEDVLVIILSVFLAIFLLLGIITLTKTIQVLNHLKRIAAKAEQIAGKAEAASEFFQKAATKVALSRLIANIVHSVREKDTKEDDKNTKEDNNER